MKLLITVDAGNNGAVAAWIYDENSVSVIAMHSIDSFRDFTPQLVEILNGIEASIRAKSIAVDGKQAVVIDQNVGYIAKCGPASFHVLRLVGEAFGVLVAKGYDTRRIVYSKMKAGILPTEAWGPGSVKKMVNKIKGDVSVTLLENRSIAEINVVAMGYYITFISGW